MAETPDSKERSPIDRIASDVGTVARLAWKVGSAILKALIWTGKKGFEYQAYRNEHNEHWPRVISEARADQSEMDQLAQRLLHIMEEDAEGPRPDPEQERRSGDDGGMDIQKFADALHSLRNLATRHRASDARNTPEGKAEFWNGVSGDPGANRQYLSLRNGLDAILENLEARQYWSWNDDDEGNLHTVFANLRTRVAAVILDEASDNRITSFNDLDTLIQDLENAIRRMRLARQKKPKEAAAASDARKLRTYGPAYGEVMREFDAMVQRLSERHSFWNTKALAPDGGETVLEEARKIQSGMRKAVRRSVPGDAADVWTVNTDGITDLHTAMQNLAEYMHVQIEGFNPKNLPEGVTKERVRPPDRRTTPAGRGVERAVDDTRERVARAIDTISADRRPASDARTHEEGVSDSQEQGTERTRGTTESSEAIRPSRMERIKNIAGQARRRLASLFSGTRRREAASTTACRATTPERRREQWINKARRLINKRVMFLLLTATGSSLGSQYYFNTRSPSAGPAANAMSNPGKTEKETKPDTEKGEEAGEPATIVSNPYNNAPSMQVRPGASPQETYDQQEAERMRLFREMQKNKKPSPPPKGGGFTRTSA